MMNHSLAIPVVLAVSISLTPTPELQQDQTPNTTSNETLSAMSESATSGLSALTEEVDSISVTLSKSLQKAHEAEVKAAKKRAAEAKRKAEEQKAKQIEIERVAKIEKLRDKEEKARKVQQAKEQAIKAEAARKAKAVEERVAAKIAAEKKAQVRAAQAAKPKAQIQAKAPKHRAQTPQKATAAQSAGTARTQVASAAPAANSDAPMTRDSRNGVSKTYTSAKIDLDYKKEGAGLSGVVGAAYSGIGTPYVWGGNTSSGWDCSGMVQWAYKQAGIDVPRGTSALLSSGVFVRTNTPQPGDLVFQNGGGHVGIYVGNGQMIGAQNPSTGTTLHAVSRNPLYGYYTLRS